MKVLSQEELTKLTEKISLLENQYNDMDEIQMFDYDDEQIYLEVMLNDGGYDNITLDRETLEEK